MAAREHNAHRASICRVEPDGTETEVHFVPGLDENRVEAAARAWALFFATGATDQLVPFQYLPEEDQLPFLGSAIRAYGIDGRLLDEWQLVRKYAA